MSKTRTAFFCQNCGAQSPKWLGRCQTCGEWNSFVEEVIQRDKTTDSWMKQSTSRTESAPVPVTEIVASNQNRTDTGDAELNRVLGGGIVPGSMILVGGEPGIGKSTLLLQAALTIKGRILYVSGEESCEQISIRAQRIGIENKNCFILNETLVQNIGHHLAELKPSLVVIDSIQTATSDTIDASAGSVSQVRESAAWLQKFAKNTNTPVILIGHITKEGLLAGPKVLEHMVDTVLQFEGDRNYGFRILRTMKNRFGSASELGIYEMTGAGLRQVSNPSEVLLSTRDEAVSGIAIASTLEGMRPLLVEVQALVSSAVYGTPQRTSTGFDSRRLNMLLAVVEKRLGYRLGNKDVFLNIAGGLRIDDPAIDLAVVAAVISSLEDEPLAQKSCFSGEVGLSGEIRAVNRLEQRIAEAAKLGFKTMYVSKYNLKEVPKNKSGLVVLTAGKVIELQNTLFGEKNRRYDENS